MVWTMLARVSLQAAAAHRHRHCHNFGAMFPVASVTWCYTVHSMLCVAPWDQTTPVGSGLSVLAGPSDRKVRKTHPRMSRLAFPALGAA